MGIADFIHWAQNKKYKVLIIEIKSETESISRHDHIKHMDETKEDENCLLCKMQYHRCKMLVANPILKIFINKWQIDSNAIIVEPKLKDDENWSNHELKSLLSTTKPLNMDEYNDDQYKSKQENKSMHKKHTFKTKQQHQQFKPNDPLNLTLDEMQNNYKTRYNHRITEITMVDTGKTIIDLIITIITIGIGIAITIHIEIIEVIQGEDGIHQIITIL